MTKKRCFSWGIPGETKVSGRRCVNIFISPGASNAARSRSSSARETTTCSCCCPRFLGTDYLVAMENPTYKQAYRIFESMGFGVTTVNMDKSGMDVQKLQESRAQIAYVMPSHQYPLGVVMPMKRRMELLEWADGGDSRYIIEDDYDSEFRYVGKPIPALQGNDTKGRVTISVPCPNPIAPAIRDSYRCCRSGCCKPMSSTSALFPPPYPASTSGSWRNFCGAAIMSGI